MKALPLVVLISGNGSNLQSLIDGQREGTLPVDIRAVISNREQAYGLERARAAGIRTHVLAHSEFPSREQYDRELIALIDGHSPELIVLAGFMRILTPEFVQHYEGRLLNIHPSLLPEFRGLNTHVRALEAGVAEHGCSVHFVTPELDAGPIILQARVPVLPGDSPEQLAARVQNQEHRAYPLAIRWLAEGRVELRADGVYLDGRRQPAPPVLDAEASPS